MDEEISEVQELLCSLPKYEDEEVEEVHVRGARTVFSYAVYQKKTGSVECAPAPDFEELGILDLSSLTLSSVRRNISETLKKWAKGKPFRVWMSDILNLQLNSAVRTYPANMKWIFQILCFGVDMVPFILTLFPCDTPAKEEEVRAVRNFSRRTARMLMSALMNFCCTEFFLVPSGLPYKNALDIEGLQKDLKEQLSRASEFYEGPTKLSSTTFQELTQATSRVMRSTTVPRALNLPSAKATEDWLLLLDTAWHKAVVELLNILEATIRRQTREPHNLLYDPEKRIKILITVLEVARRLSFKYEVTIVSEKDLGDPVETLAKELEENHGLEKRLTFRPQDSFRPKAKTPEDIVIAIDAPELQGIPGVMLNVTVAEERTFQQKKLCLLLVGETGAGRSATANTLLGRKLFKTGTSFKSITNKCETHSSDNEGVHFEITESPEFSEKYNFENFYSETQHRTYDAVCYVIKLGRFTYRDKRMFQNVKTILGDTVVRHMIFIFTHGEKLTQKLSAVASKKQGAEQEVTDKEKKELKPPQDLKKMLKQCGDRYVIFSNDSKDKTFQVKRFLETVEELKSTMDKEVAAFRCPDKEVARQRASRLGK